MALVKPVFLDTSVWVGGIIDFGPSSEPAQVVLDAVAEGSLGQVRTAWHCCLEFFSVATRLPPEFRIAPADAIRLVEHEIFARCKVVQLPEDHFRDFLKEAERDRVAGGRVYDAHIAEIARHAGCKTILTENVRHFTALVRHGIRVFNSADALKEIGIA